MPFQNNTPRMTSSQRKENSKLHPFLTRPLDEPIRHSVHLQTLLADFRARGCGTKTNKEPFRDANAVRYDYDLELDAAAIDKLLPQNNRRFPVLYCSFGNQENTTFCEGPVLRTLDINGSEDVTLRQFLENNCFSQDDKCHHQGCSISIFEHTRRYCHSGGSISVTQNQNKSYTRFAANEIITWTLCDSCNTIGPYLGLSEKSWNISFAKFNQLRIYAHELLTKPCQSSKELCHQNVFQDDTQYFAYKNLVAVFKYKPVDVRKVVIPPLTINIAFECRDLERLQEEMKKITMKGLEVSSSVHEKLVSFRDELNSTVMSTMVNEFVQMEDKERNDIRKMAGEVQVFLTEDEVGTKKRLEIQDNLLLLNRLIACYTQTWNQRIQEIINKKREEKNQLKSMSSIGSQNSNIRNSTSSIDVFSDNSFSRSTSSNFLTIIEEQNQKTLTQEDYDNANPHIQKVDPTIDSTGIEIVTAPTAKAMDPSPSSTSLSSMNVSMDDNVSTGNVPLEVAEEDVCDSKRPEHQRPISRKSDMSVKSTLKSMVTDAIHSVFNQPTGHEIESPFDCSEHYLLSPNERLPVLVKDDDPGSVIAFTLASKEYLEEVDRLQQSLQDSSKGDEEGGLTPTLEEGLEPQLSLSAGTGAVFVKSQPSKDVQQTPTKASTVEITFSDSVAKFTCRVYFPQQFRRLREMILKATFDADDGQESILDPEEAYIRSLSTCLPWKAQGGKSKATFRKSADDRFVVKEMHPKELPSFVNIANFYFDYMESLQKGRKSALAKILGVYKVTFPPTTSTTKSAYILVMENLFYRRNITQKFDLKGALRNRHVNTDNMDSSRVLQDENLVRMFGETPLYVRPSEKRLIQTAIRSDTQFLASHELLDYSLLVGLDEMKGQLVIGIIDYIRSFSWDKKMEFLIKDKLLPAKDSPTIINPHAYRDRFIDRMDGYFLVVPDPCTEVESQM